MRSRLRSALTPAEQERAANHLENHPNGSGGLGRRALEQESGLEGAAIRGIEVPLVHSSTTTSATIIAGSAARPRSFALLQRFLLELGSGEIETEQRKHAGQMLDF